MAAHLAGLAAAWRGEGGPAAAEAAARELAAGLVAYTLARQAQPALPPPVRPSALLAGWRQLPAASAWPLAESAWPDEPSPGRWGRLVEELAALPAAALAAGLAVLATPAGHHARARGSFATPTEVADLLAAWALRQGGERVLDPACGAGMLLARVALRRAWLGGPAAALWGVERDPAPAALARLALAGLGVRAAEVRVADFLAAASALPVSFEAVIANPPFVRHEWIARVEARRAAEPAGGLGRRTDLHARFWPAFTPLLVEGGRAAVVTPASWLEADYGAAVQRYLLDHYALEAIVEPAAERWFGAAGVHALLVLARRRRHDAGRDEAVTRLVRLKRPLSALLGPDGAARPAAAAGLIARLEAVMADEEGDDWRVRLVAAPRPRPRRRPRADRATSGVTAGEAAWAAPSAAAGAPALMLPWAGRLRAPAVLIELLARHPRGWCRLGELARVRYPLKTGADAFFYLTAAEAAARCLEAECLRPVVRTPRELRGLTVAETDLYRRVLLLPAVGTEALPPGARRYVEAGAAAGLHRRPTCAARRPWYALPRLAPAPLLWPRFIDERHAVWSNAAAALENQTFYGLLAPAEQMPLLAALLNSSLVALVAEVHGRSSLGQGALQFSVGQVAALPVPDVRRIAPALSAELAAAGRELLRVAGDAVSPRADEVRQWIDSLVLAALAVDGQSERTAVASEVSACRRQLVQERQRRGRGG